MQISNLIKQLVTLQENHGDVEVHIFDDHRAAEHNQPSTLEIDRVAYDDDEHDIFLETGANVESARTEHVGVPCMFPNCKEEATRWYEQADGTEFYYCLEHEEADEWESGEVTRADGVTVESAVYSCSDACEVCNE